VEERRKVLGQARQDMKLELTTEELDYGFLWETSNMFAADDRVSCVVQEDVVGDADPGIPSTAAPTICHKECSSFRLFLALFPLDVLVLPES